MIAELLLKSAKYGRWILAISLLVGLVGGTFAQIIAPYINWFIAALLFTAALRIGYSQAIGAMGNFSTVIGFIVILQIAAPLTLIFMAWILDFSHELVFVVALLLAASPLSGSPNLITLMGHDGAPALRQLLMGTALLPVTILPVLWALPEAGDLAQIIEAALRLLVVISIATVLGFVVRRYLLNNPGHRELTQIDGISTLLLAIAVIGLMASIRAEFFSDPKNLFLTMGVAITACFGLQILTTQALKRTRWAQYAVSIGVLSGTRNAALFLTAISPEISGPFILFIACYQIPMYLTPIVMRGFYSRVSAEPA